MVVGAARGAGAAGAVPALAALAGTEVVEACAVWVVAGAAG